MSRMGSTMRSAKMNETTPPKLMPPRHSTAASGTLPTEQTKLTMATRGPTSGPSIFAKVGLLVKKKLCQTLAGTHAASAPAIRKPPATSCQTEAQSMTNRWLMAVKPRPLTRRERNEPPQHLPEHVERFFERLAHG